jgi:hypothetical protein
MGVTPRGVDLEKRGRFEKKQLLDKKADKPGTRTRWQQPAGE